jgi:hypothetical protein
MHKTCAQYVRNLLVSHGFLGALSTHGVARTSMGAYKSAVTPLPVNTFTSYLYPAKTSNFTSVLTRFSPLSTPPITTTSSVNKELFIIEQGA